LYKAFFYAKAKKKDCNLVLIKKEFSVDKLIGLTKYLLIMTINNIMKGRMMLNSSLAFLDIELCVKDG